MRQESVEAAIAAVANKATYTASGAAVAGWWTANELAAIGGLVCAVIGLAIQLYFKRRTDRREAEYHAARMSDLRE